MASCEMHRMVIRPLAPRFHKDYRYVHLKVSESSIYSALEKPDGPDIVLLHGGLGTGKSTLARYIALHYTEDKIVFDHVVYLECGPHADTLTKQLDLLQLLGADEAPAAPHHHGLSGSDLTVPSRLTGLLRNQNLLIILDDIWEKEILQRMVDLRGNRVKFLVTSQLGNLCRGLNCLSVDILIEDIQPEDARKILANHARVPNQLIPLHLESIAHEMIWTTEANPLALASIATAVYGSDELLEWEAASKGFFQLLDSEDTAYILSKKYPRSFLSSMKLCFSFLKEDEENLLMLMHMCSHGSSVPEEVIYILYQHAKLQCGSATFEKSRNELESRKLVKIILTSDSQGVKQRSWSVHSLQKRFIQQKRPDARKTIFTSLKQLWGIDSASRAGPKVAVDSNIMETVLGALYFNNRFAMKVASKLGIPFDNFNTQRRNGIEPIARLLGHPVCENWTESLRVSARKVFFMYICNGVFHKVGISNLLASPISASAMVRTLKNVALIEIKVSMDEGPNQGGHIVRGGFLGDGDNVITSHTFVHCPWIPGTQVSNQWTEQQIKLFFQENATDHHTQSSKKAKWFGEETFLFPEETIEKIIARMPFPFIFKALLLSKSWSEKFHLCEGLTSLQKDITSVSTNWTTYSPVFFGRTGIRGFDGVSCQWKSILTFSYLPLQWYWDDSTSYIGPIILGSCHTEVTECKNLMFVTNVITQSHRKLSSQIPEDYFKETHGVEFVPEFAMLLPGNSGNSHTYRVLLLSLAYDVFQSLQLTSDHFALAVYDSSLNEWSMSLSKSFTWGRMGSVSDQRVFLHGNLYFMYEEGGDEWDEWQLFIHRMDSDKSWVTLRLSHGQSLSPSGMNIFAGGIVRCGESVMVVIWPESRPHSRLSMETENNSHNLRYIPPNSFQIYQLDPDSLLGLDEFHQDSLRLVKVCEGPPEVMWGVGLSLCSARMTFSSDNNFIYFGQLISGSPVMTYSVHRREWGCLHPPCDFGSMDNETVIMGPSTFAPGLNPFAIV